jgi:hypothetical protein
MGSKEKAHPKIMPTNKKRSRTSKGRLEAAAVYTEDIGTQGIKTSAGSAPSNQKPISSLPLPKDEDKRRLKRKVGTCWS